MKQKHFYVLRGITEEQINAWKEEIRTDLAILKKDELSVPVIQLTWMEALKMKFQMFCSNVRYHYRFKLFRI